MPDAKSEDAVPADEQTLEQAQRQVQHLQVALEHRTAISEACGILMERFYLDREAAFALLQRLSSTRNLKLYDIALEIVTTREVEGLPDSMRPRPPTR
ncbi:MAG: ANTAR domain-containing protein [Marmoricola sp.]|nr:ANTAR domain-containing protein [Marmoricola sp.]